MIAISVKADVSAVLSKIGRLQQDLRERALVRALNRTTEAARTAMSREIRQTYNMTAALVRDKLRVRQARWVRGQVMLEAELYSPTRRRSMNVIHFVERFVTLAEARRRAKAGTLADLRFKFKRTGGRKTIKPQGSGSRPFIGNKGRTVFAREGRARLPIVPVQTIDVPQMFNSRRINAHVAAKIRTDFPRIFEREARFALARFKAR